MSDEMKPLAIIGCHDRTPNPEAERRRKRDNVITYILTLCVAAALIWAWINSGPQIVLPRAAAARAECPETNVRLSAHEYELQRRRCEAVASGALERR